MNNKQNYATSCIVIPLSLKRKYIDSISSSKILAFIKYYDAVNTAVRRRFAIMSPSGVWAKLLLMQCNNIIYKRGELKTKN